MQWVAVFLTEDGPHVVGPFERENEALSHIVASYGDDPVDGMERYDESPLEWVVPLHYNGRRRGAPEIEGYQAEDPKSEGYHERMAAVWDSREGK